MISERFRVTHLRFDFMFVYVSRDRTGMPVKKLNNSADSYTKVVLRNIDLWIETGATGPFSEQRMNPSGISGFLFDRTRARQTPGRHRHCMRS